MARIAIPCVYALLCSLISKAAPTMIARFTPALQAIILAFVAYAFFSIADTSAKFLVHKFPSALCVTIPATMASIAELIWILLGKGRAGFETKQLKLHLLRGGLIALMANLVVRALQTLPLPDFYGIIFLLPFIVVLLSTVILKEKLKPYRIAVIALAFTGVMIITGPKFDTLSTGMLLTIITVFVSAINVFVMRRIGQHEYLPLYGFFPLFVITLTGIPQSIPHIPLLVSTFTWTDFGLFALYAFALFVGHTAIPLAFSRTPEMSLIAPMHYTQMLWGIFYGILVFNQSPSLSTLVGAFIIISSGLYMIWRERHHVRATAPKSHA